MEQHYIDIIPHPDFLGRAKVFQETYDLIDIWVQGDSRFSKRSLKLKSLRSCQFCGLSSPENFSNWSHLIPKLMGNRDMYSDFECDSCNEKFSQYENDLAEYLGVSRSLTGLNGNGKAKSFSARKLKAKSRSFIGDNILIIAPEDLKREGNKTTISYTKNSFTPSKVYKALVKASLSLLGSVEIKNNYRTAINYLMVGDKILKGGVITGYSLSYRINLPLNVFHFRKKKSTEKVPTDVVVFNFQNHMISVPLLLHSEDMKSNYDSYNIIHPPPYFVSPLVMEQSIPVSYIRDLSSDTIITDEEENITFSLDSESLKNSVVYNPETQLATKTNFGEHDIKYVIITKGDVNIDPKEFSEFIRKQMGN